MTANLLATNLIPRVPRPKYEDMNIIFSGFIVHSLRYWKDLTGRLHYGQNFEKS